MILRNMRILGCSSYASARGKGVFENSRKQLEKPMKHPSTRMNILYGSSEALLGVRFSNALLVSALRQ